MVRSVNSQCHVSTHHVGSHRPAMTGGKPGLRSLTARPGSSYAGSNQEEPDEKSLRGQDWENLNAGVRSQPYKITMSRRSLLWHAEHLPRVK